ncbi:glycosyltransferase family 2 protein [Segetibacter koreensis]|uniref:glycosyltransferase family 2 protein n=1 Tax=Segetibacter koreensis TaxID=398037 RepID=UPI00035EA191|nr:glycosyltransferase family A protein [Segetibacter koreensis]
MQNNPLFTVVTITYNSALWVRHTIQSVLAQSFVNFELIIGDDCSTDNTWQIINEFSDPRIVTFRNEVNIGEYPNRNKALSLAKGEYLIFVDGDDILYKDSLERFQKYLQGFPNAAAIWGVGGLDFAVLPYLFEPIELTKLIYFSDYPISTVGFAESLFKISMLKEIGGLSNDFAIGDTFLKKRIACQYPVLLTTTGYTFWRQSDDQASRRVTKNYTNLKENYIINSIIVNAEYFPLQGEELELAKKNINISVIKLLIKNTLLKGKLMDLIKLMKQLQIPFSNLNLVSEKIYLSYKCNSNGTNPLMNNYNFTFKNRNKTSFLNQS